MQSTLPARSRSILLRGSSMTRHTSSPARRIARWIPRGLLLGTVVVGGTLSLSDAALAKGGLPSLFGKSQPANDSKTADVVPEIRKLLADARAAATQRDYSMAIRQAERAQKLSEGSAAAIRTAPDCSPAQIATVLQQYRQARAGRDVRLSLDTSPKVSQPVRPAPKVSDPIARPPVAVPPDRSAAAETKSGLTAAPVEKMFARGSRPVTTAPMQPPAIAEAAPRTTPKNITEFRPTPVASRTSAAAVEIRKRPDEPQGSRSSFFDESLIRTATSRQSVPPQLSETGKTALIPDRPNTAVAAEVAAMDSRSLVASQAAASTTSGIDPALTERLLRPLSGMRVRFQEPSFTPTAPAEDVVSAPAEDVLALATDPDSTDGTGEDQPASEAEMQTPFAMAETEVETESTPEAGTSFAAIETLAPIHEVQTAEAIAEIAPTVEQVSDEQPVQDTESPRTFRSSSGVRYLEWSPVVEAQSLPVISANVAEELPRPIDAAAGASFNEAIVEIDETAGVEQAGFRGRDEWSSAGRGEAATRRPVEDEATGPFVVFREPAAGASTAWEIAPLPPAEIAAATTSQSDSRSGMTRETVWWFSAAGVLLAVLGLSTWLPRRR